MSERKIGSTQLAQKDKLLTESDKKSYSNKKTYELKAKDQDSCYDISSDVLTDTNDDIDDISDELDDDNLSDGVQDRILDELKSLTNELSQGEAESRNNLERRSSKDSSSTKRSQNFQSFYDRACKNFLQNRDEKIDKKRKEKEEEEIRSVTLKPNLIAKQQTKHIPLLEKAKASQARKNQEIQKIMKEREEKAEKELQDLTFKPSINEISKALINHMNREDLVDRLYNHRKGEGSGNHDDANMFKPKINKNSTGLAQNIIKKTSEKVEDRLLLHADIAKSKKQKLLEEVQPNFAPRLNKNTQKLVENRRRKDVTTTSKAETIIEKTEAKLVPSSLKRGSVHDVGSHSFDVIKAKDISPIKNRVDTSASRSNITVNGVNLDDRLMDNLKQLTLLLQSDTKAQSGNKQSRSKTPRKDR